jgi:nucleotide-binding universal stress UspA family protein
VSLLARAGIGPIHLLTTRDRVFPYPAVAGRDQPRRSADEAQRQAAAPIEIAQREARVAADESGLGDAEAVGEVGDPADVVTQVAKERSVDVIVVGSRN